MTSTSEGIDASVRSAVLATYAVFIASGIAFASWASRIPQVRDRLHLDPSELGLVLLAMAAGSVIALPLSGVIIGHFGPAGPSAPRRSWSPWRWPWFRSATWWGRCPW